MPIIGVVSRKQFLAPGRFLDQGADALLMREDTHRPTLYDLLISVQRNPDAARTAARTHTPELALPWRRSEMIGALICDVTGSIVDANRSLATWLGYPNTDELRGRNVLHDLLKNRDDWVSWKQVAGDTIGCRRQEWSSAVDENRSVCRAKPSKSRSGGLCGSDRVGNVDRPIALDTAKRQAINQQFPVLIKH